MLPEILSNQICSLRPGEVKNTVSCYFKLDKQGSILNQYITESIIKSDYRFNYDEVDAYFTDVKPTFTPELDEALLIFKELSGILLEERVKKGYLNLELPEENFKFDEEGSITDIYLEYETVSHQMIENAMLLANELVAKRLKKNLPQSIFRTHDSPEEDRIEKLKFTLSAYNIKMIPNSKLNFTYQNILAQVDALGSHDIFDMMVLRSMKRAMYTTECKPHFGLAISTYTHFTSPIRRFSDLVVHHQIKSILNSEQEPKFTKAQLSFYANTCTEQENLADESEREITNRLIRAFMKNYVGEVMSGKVVELTKNKVILKLQTIPVRVILETYFLKDGPYEFDQQYYSLRQERGSRLIRLGDILTVTIDRITDEVFMKEVKEQDVDRVMTDTEKQRILDRTFNHDDPRNPVRPGHASREERRFGKSSGSQRFSPDRKSKDPRKSFTKDRKAPKSTGRRRKV
jgi:ribonuclease R